MPFDTRWLRTAARQEQAAQVASVALPSFGLVWIPPQFARLLGEKLRLVSGLRAGTVNPSARWPQCALSGVKRTGQTQPEALFDRFPFSRSRSSRRPQWSRIASHHRRIHASAGQRRRYSGPWNASACCPRNSRRSCCRCLIRCCGRRIERRISSG